MDFERGYSLPDATKAQPTESGYSESEQALDIETKGVDFKNGKKRKPLQQASRQVKILTAFQQTNTKLAQVVLSLSQISVDSSRQQEKILDEIRSLKNLQDELLHCLLLEQRGALTKDIASKEAWNLIE
jgi:hypothetical protein